MKHEPRGDFFVGYLPMPRSRKVVALLAAGFAVALGVGVAAMAAGLQRSPGQDIARIKYGWNAEGVFLNDPYAMLRHTDDDGSVMHTLLVRPGKNGVPHRPELEGKRVKLKGALMRRDGRGLAEVYGLEAVVDGAERSGAQEESEVALGPVLLSGMIVDSKCYYGRMRPGEGQVHRACAQYCIDSGIPPVLVTHDAKGLSTHYLLTDEDGGTIKQKLLPWVAERVMVRGKLTRRDDLLILAVSGEPQRLF